MAIGDANKNHLNLLIEWRKRKTIEEEQDRKKQTLHLEYAFATSRIVQAMYQVRFNNTRIKKHTLWLFLKERRRSIKKQPSYKIEKFALEDIKQPECLKPNLF